VLLIGTFPFSASIPAEHLLSIDGDDKPKYIQIISLLSNNGDKRTAQWIVLQKTPSHCWHGTPAEVILYKEHYMAQMKVGILRSYFDEVINRKQLNLIPKYVSEKFIGHGMPYVGMGIMNDASSGDKVRV
jgi:hypothetical protein